MAKKINEFVAGDELLGFFLLSSYSTGTKKDGETFFRGTISDISGKIQFVCWQKPENYGISENASGHVVKVKGQVSEYEGNLQLKVYNIRLATDEDKPEYSASDIVCSAPIDIEASLNDVETLINSIADDELKTVCNQVLAERKEQFISTPAGKTVHHAFPGGLLMHTRNMMVLSDFISKMYPTTINRDLLLAGTFLHDICKIEEFTLTDLNLVNAYSVEGQLMGHLVMASEYVGKICDQLNIDADKKLLLQHVILAHHGEGEMGSPVTPKIAEAEALHIIDLMDSRMEIYAEELSNLKVGEITPRDNWALGHRIYKWE